MSMKKKTFHTTSTPDRLLSGSTDRVGIDRHRRVEVKLAFRCRRGEVGVSVSPIFQWLLYSGRLFSHGPMCLLATLGVLSASSASEFVTPSKRSSFLDLVVADCAIAFRIRGSAYSMPSPETHIADAVAFNVDTPSRWKKVVARTRHACSRHFELTSWRIMGKENA